MTNRASLIVSAKVRGVLAEQSVRQGDLAAMLGLVAQSLSARMTGRTPWRVDEVVAMAAALQVPLARVLPLDELAEPEPHAEEN